MARRAEQCENEILKMFLNEDGSGKKFTYKNIPMEVLLVSKPKQVPTEEDPRPGNPKTDIYVEIKNLNNGDITTYKISYKMENASFVDSHLKEDAFLRIFKKPSKDVLRIIFNSQDTDYQTKLLEPKINKNGTIKVPLGLDFCLNTGYLEGGKWKTPSTNPLNDIDDLNITTETLKEIYCGTNMLSSKSDCTLNDNNPVKNSGIATHYLRKNPENIKSISDLLDSIEEIDESFFKNPKHSNIYPNFKICNLYLKDGGYYKYSNGNLNATFDVYIDTMNKQRPKIMHGKINTGQVTNTSSEVNNLRLGNLYEENGWIKIDTTNENLPFYDCDEYLEDITNLIL